MRGMSQRSDDGTFAARVTWQANSTRTGKSAGQKMAESIGKAADSMSLDPNDFGYFMTFLPSAVQRKVLNCFLTWISFLAEKAERGLYFEEEEHLLCEDAKVIHAHTAFLRG